MSEKQHTVTAASKAFYLNFRQWCLASHAASRLSTRPHSSTCAAAATRRCERAGQNNARLAATSPHMETSARRFGRTWVACRHSTVALPARRCYSASGIQCSSTTTTTKLHHDLRGALRTLTRPCVVLTASLPDSNTWTGATLSSFDTISLDPVPQVSFNIKVPSRTHDALTQSGDVCVHILSASPQGALIADVFTKGYEDSSTPFQLLQKAGCTFTRGKDETAPRLYMEDGVIARLTCRRDSRSQEIDVGDHKLCTLTVTKVEHTTPHGTAEDEVALAYGQRAFRSLGNAITPSETSEVERTIDRATTQDDADLKPPHSPGPKHSHARSQLPQQPRNPLLSSHNTTMPPAKAVSAGFHTSVRHNMPLKHDPHEPIAWCDSRTESTHVSPEAMQETLEDFLCHSQIRPASNPRKKIWARVHANQKREQLKHEANFVAQDDLHKFIQGAERYIARSLAWDAAEDLRDMLDRGRVSQSRIQYLEKCIEEGQAALLYEATAFANNEERKDLQLKDLPNDVHAFERADTHMRTELMRLRELYEEEDGGWTD